MDSNLIYPTSSPEVVAMVDAFNIPSLKRFPSLEVDDTDDEASPDRGDKDTPRSKSRKPQATFTVTDINHHHPAELPLALWPPSNNTLGVICIPPQPFHTPVKRKHRDRSPDPYCFTSSIFPAPELPAKKWRPKEFDLETSSEPEVLVQRSKEKPKHCPRSSEIPCTSPKRRGQPHKAPMDPQTCDFSAHVYVEIANPPKLNRGKTHKTDKYVLQGPTTEGPFTFTHHSSWKSFLLQVAQLAELEEENITLTQMTWHFQGRTKSLLLGNIGGFTAMVTQVRALKAGASAIIMLGLPVPPAKPSCGGRNAPAVIENVNVTGSSANEVGWGKKVYSSHILMACT